MAEPLKFTRRTFMCLVFLVLFLTAIPAFVSPAQAEATNLVKVYGKVINSNGEPVPDAQVIFWTIDQTLTAETNASGFYEISVEGDRSYQIYAYYDNSSTPGFDYVPAYNQTYIEKSLTNVSFTLLPGASINPQGNLRSFETLKPPMMMLFTVIDEYGTLNGVSTVTRYGEGLLVSWLLNLDVTVIAPSDMPIKVNVLIRYTDGSERHCTIDQEGDYLNLTEGELLNVDLRTSTLGADIDACHGYIASARAAVDEAESRGFYVSYERNELLRAEELVDAASSATTEASYDEAQADLRQAYLITRSVENDVLNLYVNAPQSVIFITPFLAFTAISIASVLLDGRGRRLILSLFLYGVLFGFLYVFYPGYSLLQKAGATAASLIFQVAFWIVGPFLLAYFMMYGLPYLFREKTIREKIKPMSAVVAAFGMSARNLRRRKLRTFLIATVLFTSVFAFTALTSFSVEYGIFASLQPGPLIGPTEGFLLRKPSETLRFEPLQPGILDWLQARPEVALAVPRMENIPQTRPLGYINSSKWEGHRPVCGVLGVLPSLERNITKIDTVIVKGKFLQDDDLNGILISEKLANELGVEVNDTVYVFDETFTLTGIFDDTGFDKLNDLDGQPLAPWWIPLLIEPCFSSQVVIMHYETARNFSFMVMSRIDVKTFSTDEIIPTARLAVLHWEGTSAFATVGGRVHRLSIGTYSITSGFASTLIPLGLVILNIAVMMTSVVRERKRDIAIMSSVGLNPFHISAVFVAEAIVIGVIAGSLGYIFGLTSYRFMTLLPVQPALKQKVGGSWSLIALCVAIATAVLGSAIPSIKASTIVTPSLIRRWKIKIEEAPRKDGGAWLLRMPIRIPERNLEEFFGFMEDSLRGHMGYHAFDSVNNLKLTKDETEPAAFRLSFTYSCPEMGLVTENELFTEENRVPKWYVVNLSSKTPRGFKSPRDKSYVKRTASFMRRLILQYSQKQKSK